MVIGESFISTPSFLGVDIYHCAPKRLLEHKTLHLCSDQWMEVGMLLYFIEISHMSFFLIDFGDRKTLICPTYWCVHWLILICALPGNRTPHLGVFVWCSNQLSYPCRGSQESCITHSLAKNPMSYHIRCKGVQTHCSHKKDRAAVTFDQVLAVGQ